MKTKLPESITSVNKAKQFLLDLIENGECFHPEDDAHDIEWSLPEGQIPTAKECDHLNRLMSEMYALPETWSTKNPTGWDPCWYMIDNDPAFEYLRGENENGNDFIVS